MRPLRGFNLKLARLSPVPSQLLPLLTPACLQPSSPVASAAVSSPSVATKVGMQRACGLYAVST
jgi:hypothetical protein